MPNSPTPCTLTPNWAGEFRSFDSWVNKASSWIDGKAVCIDNKGRRCLNGGHFMRARDEDAFPIRFFWDCEAQESNSSTALS